MTSLWATSLTQLTYLNESVQLSLVSTKISLIYLFFVLLLLGYCPTPHITLLVLHVATAFQELDKQTITSFVSCSQGIRLKISLEQWTSAISLKVSWKDLYSEFHDRWLRLACNRGLEIVLLDHRCVKNMRPQYWIQILEYLKILPERSIVQYTTLWFLHH